MKQKQFTFDIVIEILFLACQTNNQPHVRDNKKKKTAYPALYTISPSPSLYTKANNKHKPSLNIKAHVPHALPVGLNEVLAALGPSLHDALVPRQLGLRTRAARLANECYFKHQNHLN